MKVVLITNCWTILNGVARSVLITQKALQNLGHEVVVITPGNAEDSTEDVIFVPGIEVPGSPYPVVDRVRRAHRKSILQTIFKQQPDIIHCHDPYSTGRFGFLAAKKLKVPLIITAHAMYGSFAEQWGARIFTQYLSGFFMHAANYSAARQFNRCTRVIAPSQKSRNYLFDLGVKDDKIVILPTPIPAAARLNNEQHEAARQELKQKYDIPMTAKILLVLCRLDPDKEVERAIEAFGNLGEINAYLLIVGEGTKEKELKELAASQPNGRQIIFTGGISDREEVSKLQNCSDLHIHTSLSDTQCLGIAESQLIGTPCLIFAGTAPCEFVTNGVHGIHINPNDPLALNQGIKKLLSNPIRLVEMARNCRFKPHEGILHEDQFAEKLATLYQSLIATP